MDPLLQVFNVVYELENCFGEKKDYFVLQYHWLGDYVNGVRRLRTAATSGLIVHLPGDMWAWRALEIMMLAGENWLVHQSSLTVYQQRHLWASRRNGRKSESFAYQHLRCVSGPLTSRKILRNVASGFTSHSKEGVLHIFITLKIHRLSQVWTHDPWV
jgi:hypothetical protein